MGEATHRGVVCSYPLTVSPALLPGTSSMGTEATSIVFAHHFYPRVPHTGSEDGEILLAITVHP